MSQQQQPFGGGGGAGDASPPAIPAATAHGALPPPLEYAPVGTAAPPAPSPRRPVGLTVIAFVSITLGVTVLVYALWLVQTGTSRELEAVIRPATLLVSRGALYLNIALSALLVVAGLVVLADRRAGRSLHRCWACSRLVLVFLELILAFSIATDLEDAAHPRHNAYGSISSETFLLIGVAGATGACIYPIVVLFVMSGPSAARYYERFAPRDLRSVDR